MGRIKFQNTKQFRNLLQYLQTNPNVNVNMFIGILFIDDNNNNVYMTNENHDDDGEKQSSNRNKSRCNMRMMMRKIFDSKNIISMKNEINLQKNYFVWQCHYKPLSDIINGDIKLSWPIKLSFINDIIQV